MTDNPYKNANSFIKAHVGLWSMLGATYKKLNSKVVFIKSYNNKTFYWTSTNPNYITKKDRGVC